jgi:hypothetical protein
VRQSTTGHVAAGGLTISHRSLIAAAGRSFFDGFLDRFTGFAGALLNAAQQFVVLAFGALEIVIRSPQQPSSAQRLTANQQHYDNDDQKKADRAAANIEGTGKHR